MLEEQQRMGLKRTSRLDLIL